MEKLSVVIPVYNVEQYLEQCLKSVCEQSYQNLEIILVNDGSTDGSLHICENVASVDTRVKVISQSNGGLSAARNTGMKYATGEYITFIDSDDYVDTEMFSDMIAKMEENNADISVCNFEKFQGEEANGNTASSGEIEMLTAIEALGKLYSEQQAIFVTAWGKIYKRELFYGIYYPIGKINEDVFTTHKTYAKARKILYMNCGYYKYRQRKGSIIHTTFSIRNLDSLEGLRELKDFVIKIDNFISTYNVIQEYIEKLIYYYFKCGELESQSQKLRTQILAEAKQLVREYKSNFTIKERVKFDLFIYFPKLFRVIRGCFA